MAFFNWHNTAFHYSDEGVGEPLIFLHGLGGRVENWFFQRRYFAKHYRVICLDLPGQGQSQGKHIPFDQYWQVLLALIQHLSLKKVSICGLSKGARVGIRLSAYHPELVKHLVIVNAFIHLSDEDRKKRIDTYNLLTSSSGSELWARKLLDAMGVEPGTAIERGFISAANSMDSEHIRSTFMQIIDCDQYPDLKNIRANTLLISGERDKFIPSYCMPFIHQEIAHSQIIRLPHVGHLPYLESPDEFNTMVENVISR